MQKYLKFFIIFLLISSIPAVFFFLFPNAASNVNSGDIPTLGLLKGKKSETQEVQASHYLIRLTPGQTPLKQGPQVLRLEILNRNSGSHWDGMPLVTIQNKTAAMAPVSVEQLPEAGFYKLKANFPETGEWRLSLNLKNPDETLGLTLYVPAS